MVYTLDLMNNIQKQTLLLDSKISRLIWNGVSSRLLLLGPNYSGSTHSLYCSANQENKWTCRDFKVEFIGAVKDDVCFESAQSYWGQQANNLEGKVWILCSSDAMIAQSVLVNAANILSSRRDDSRMFTRFARFHVFVKK